MALAPKFGLLALAGAGCLILAPPALAQERIPIDIGQSEEEGTAQETRVVNILAAPPARDEPTAAQAKECDEEREASEISGEIVVCRKLPVDNSDRFAGSYADWLKDYAERSMNHNAIPAPDVDNTGLPPGMVPMITIVGCFIPPCPKPPALLIDVEALPAPPIGSDAYWKAQGLAGRGNEGELTPEARRMLEEELVLPPKPDFGEEEP